METSIPPSTRVRSWQATSRAWLDQIFEHARRAYPDECCGILTRLRASSGSAPIQVYPCRNIQNQLHDRDPERHPRRARTGYYIDPRDLLRVEREAARSAASMAVVYHSHTDTGAYFSDLDRRRAAPYGEPLLPDVAYLVVSVIDHKVRDVMLYAWDADLAEYVDVDLGLLD